jgi:hypothetical protein
MAEYFSLREIRLPHTDGGLLYLRTKKVHREYKDKPPRETANSRGFFFVLYENNIYENSC